MFPIWSHLVDPLFWGFISVICILYNFIRYKKDSKFVFIQDI